MQPPLEGDEGEAALAFSPLRQVRAAVLALQKIGFGLEVPLQNLDKIAAILQRLTEKAKDRHLALQGPEASQLGDELEDAQLVGLGVLGQPHLAGGRDVERAQQQPLLAAGDRTAGCQ